MKGYVEIVARIGTAVSHERKKTLLTSGMYIQRIRYLYFCKYVRFSHSQSTVNHDEISRFNKLSNHWWNEQGDLKPLHSMNGVRVLLIRNGLVNCGKITEEQLQCPKPLSTIKFLDVGCGGGILSEALARLGGEVTGLDAAESLISVAKDHASQDPQICNKINYICSTIEEHCCENNEIYDAVIASEVLEHISEKRLFLESCVKTLKPGGSLFITTLNKTYTSHLVGIIIAEIIWKLLPKNTHDWELFITPQELECLLESCGCTTLLVNGLFYNICVNKWYWTKYTGVSYALHAVKRLNS